MVLRRVLLVVVFLAGWIAMLRAELPPLVDICALQGTDSDSPYTGQVVRTRGVVYADLDQTSKQGFFIQHENCDGEAATSDGLFVYMGESVQVVTSGDYVEVSGNVNEYYNLTEVVSTPADVTILSQGNSLPAVSELNPPFSNATADIYFEALEGMRVGLDSGRVVGPTNTFDRTYLARADLNIWHVFYDDPAGTGELICLDDGGLYEIPESKVGNLVNGLIGALDYSYGRYQVLALNQPQVLPESAGSENPNIPNAGSLGFQAATFNLANLFDDQDDPLTEDTDLSAPEYQRRLHKRALAIHDALGEPDLLAVQEVENQTVLIDLLAQPEIQANYAYVWQDGPDRRGIDVALLYRTDRAALLESHVYQGCTTLVDGMGPDGNLDVENPNNAVTCDSNGDQVLDGNRLFSRPPLAARLNVTLVNPYTSTAGDETVELWIIVNHFKSKTQDTDTVKYTAPRRLEQASFVGQLVDEFRATHPNTQVIVMGDLNDYPDSAPLAELAGHGLSDLTSLTDQGERYTYIYEGISFVMDYALLAPLPNLAPASVTPLHINADYPYALWSDENTLNRSSDHDPLLVDLIVIEKFIYLPAIIR